MSDTNKYPTCSKHSNKRIQKVCLDLDCQEILLCIQCEQQKKHKVIEDLLLYKSIDSTRILSNIERLQNMRKRIIDLNEKVTNQKNNANLIVEECFTQIYTSFQQYFDACQASVQNGVSLFSEKFRKMFSKLLQEISEDTYKIKKHITRVNEFFENNSNQNQSLDNYTLTQGLKNVIYTQVHKIPHLEKICEDLESKQKINLINTDCIRNNFENIQIDLQHTFDKLTLNAFPTNLDTISLEYELLPPKMNYNSIYSETITQVQLEQTIFAHLNPISSVIAIKPSIIGNEGQSTQSLPTIDFSSVPQLISTGWDGTIKGWSLTKNQPVIEINTYNGGISASSLIESQNIIVCSHFNYSLELYKLDFNSNQQMISSEIGDKINKQEEHSEIKTTNQKQNNKKNYKLSRIDPHEKTIQSIIVKEGNINRIICGCSSSKLLSIPIERFSQESIDKLTAHTSSVQTLCDIKSSNDQLFLSGSYDSLVFLWDLRRHKPVNMVQNSNEIVNSLSQLSEFTFITGSHDSFIKIWDFRMFKTLRTIFAHRDAVSKTASFYSKLYNNSQQSVSSSLSNIFISSGNDNILNIWNIFDKQALRFSMKGHSDVVWAMDIDIENKKIYTGSRNEEIKVWSYI